ncbi:MAG TPA: hypothetical protein VK638_42385 [Edaphobacter sp.]|nr:hypothetical protein [Edaphobacter sp.]
MKQRASAARPGCYSNGERDVEAIDSFVYDRVWLRGSIVYKVRVAAKNSEVIG